MATSQRLTDLRSHILLNATMAANCQKWPKSITCASHFPRQMLEKLPNHSESILRHTNFFYQTTLTSTLVTLRTLRIMSACAPVATWMLCALQKQRQGATSMWPTLPFTRAAKTSLRTPFTICTLSQASVPASGSTLALQSMSLSSSTVKKSTKMDSSMPF